MERAIVTGAAGKTIEFYVQTYPLYYDIAFVPKWSSTVSIEVNGKVIRQCKGQGDENFLIQVVCDDQCVCETYKMHLEVDENGTYFYYNYNDESFAACD